MKINVTKRRSESQIVDFQFVQPKQVDPTDLVEDLRSLDDSTFRAVISAAKKVRWSDKLYVKALQQVEEA